MTRAAPPRRPRPPRLGDGAPSYRTELWYLHLLGACARHPRGIAGVAQDLGYRRETLSLVVHGRYQASVDQIAAAVMAAYDRHPCPHSGAEVTAAQCATTASAAAPTNSPRAMRQWRACQGCPHNPARPAGQHPEIAP